MYAADRVICSIAQLSQLSKSQRSRIHMHVIVVVPGAHHWRIVCGMCARQVPEESLRACRRASGAHLAVQAHAAVTVDST